MPTLIFDIETIGEQFDELDTTSQESLTRWIKKESDHEDAYRVALDDVKNGLGFSPLTGQIVVIGILDYEKNKGVVYFQAPGLSIAEFTEGDFTFKQATEQDMLQLFWNGAAHYQEFVSFNGRGFDVPFLMVRSAIHNIKPSKDLMSNRYMSSQKFGCKHIDLLDQLTFYGATRRKGSLHLWSRAFGIKSPKADGIDGDDVARLFAEQKYIEIAKYNTGDLYATKELYTHWNTYLNFSL